MDVSIVVITFNEEKNIRECIESIFKQRFPGRFELIVADGKSKDKTIEIVKGYMKKHKNLRLVIDPGKYQNTSRNLGVRSAHYDYVAFTDADCIVPKDWLSKLSRRYSELKKVHKNLAGVGGANIPFQKDDSRFTNAVKIAFDSYIGSAGSIQARPFTKDAPARSISCTNALYEKTKLFSAGLFPVYKGNLGDDWILGLNMNKKGYLLMGIKDSSVLHKFRPTPKRFWKNMLLYGNVRMRFIRMYPMDNKLAYYLPLGFIIVIAASILSIWNSWFLLPLLYFPIIFAYSLYLSIMKRDAGITLDVFLVFILIHFGYAVGEVIGLKWLFMKS